MLSIIAPQRISDSWGSGAFGAPRGDHKHRGIDFIAAPKSLLKSNIVGRVTKLGYPYGDDLSFRYVQITDIDGYRWRYFYVSPKVKMGDIIKKGMVIGEVQNLNPRYKGITNHVHLEIKDPDGKIINPQAKIDKAGAS